MLSKYFFTKSVVQKTIIVATCVTTMSIPVAALAWNNPQSEKYGCGNNCGIPTITQILTQTPSETPTATPKPKCGCHTTPTVTPQITTIVVTATPTPTPNTPTINVVVEAANVTPTPVPPKVQPVKKAQTLPKTGSETDILFGLFSLIPVGLKLRRMK